MIKATQIEVTRGEGRSDMDFSTYVLATWEEANNRIADIAKTVEGHADKVDFKVRFEDGYAYAGTICVKNADLMEEQTLTGHIREFLAFEMGLSKPAHLSERDYGQFMTMRAANTEHVEEIARIATNYRIG